MKNSLYDRVTRKIIDEMEAGVLPWERPWTDGSVMEPARNALTGRRYSGINVLLLWDAVCERGFSTNRWMTFNQARKSAGGIRRHERATRIVFANRYLPRTERERVESGIISPQEAEVRFRMKAYSVFNLDQLNDPPPRLWPAPRKTEAMERFRSVDTLVRQNRAEIRSFGNDAYYNHERDFIVIPPVARFPHIDDYCATLLHELTHWTGHASRLRRGFGQEVSDGEYIREELIAELGAAYLSANFGIRPRARHSDYIAYWLAALRSDSRALFVAASCATQAADFLLDRGSGARQNPLSENSSCHQRRQRRSPRRTLSRSRRQADNAAAGLPSPSSTGSSTNSTPIHTRRPNNRTKAGVLRRRQSPQQKL